MKNKYFVFLVAVMVVCLFFVSCGKKDDGLKQTSTNVSDDFEKSINDAKEVVLSYNDSLKKGDFEGMLICTDIESKLGKSIKNMGYADALSMFGFDKATSLQMAENDIKKIHSTVLENTQIEIEDVKINVDRSLACADVIINEPDYSSIGKDGLVAEFLSTKGMHETELSNVSYDEYQALSKEYASWICDKKIPSLKKITVKKDYNLKVKDGKWLIYEIE